MSTSTRFSNFLQQNIKKNEIPTKKKFYTGCSGFIGYHLVKALAENLKKKR